MMKVEVYTNANIIVNITNNNSNNGINVSHPIEAPDVYIIIRWNNECDLLYVKSLYTMVITNKSICYNETIVKSLIEKHNKAYFKPIFQSDFFLKKDKITKHKINTNDFRYRSIWKLFSSFILGLQRK